MNTRPWVPCLGLVLLAMVACSQDQRSRQTVSEVAERQAASLALQQEIPGGAAGDDFATSVSIDGTTAIVGANMAGSGAGAAYVFVLSGTTWVRQATFTGAPGDLFGTSVSVSGDTAAVGAPGHGSLRGAVYVFTRSGTTWTQQPLATASDGVADDQLGASVAVSGSTVVAGAPFRTKAQGTSTDEGAVYVFASTGAQQAKLVAGDAAPFDMFGNAVAIAGGTVVIGAPYRAQSQGTAYVFTGSGTSWSQQAELVAGDPAVRDRFGASVAVSSGTIFVGAPDKGPPGATFQGAAYVFTGSGASWSQQAKLVANDAVESDVFGSAVSIDLAAAIVGAPGKTTGQGAVYAFTGSGASWSAPTEVKASDGMQGDFFGNSVSITSGEAVVGAPFKSSYTGEAYFYTSGTTTGLPNGATCTTSSQCVSEICAGGFCCATACSGCNSCSTGTCTAPSPTCVTLQRPATSVADAYLARATPNRNFGTSTDLYVGTVSGSPRESLIRFDLSTIPAGSTITSATLTLTRVGGSDVAVNVYQVTASWSEGGVTWNSFGQAFAPSVVTTLPSTAPTTMATLTSLVQEWVSTPSTNDGIALTYSGTGHTVFASSEYGTASDLPELSVCYTSCP
jgi:FG-GAP repeat